MAWYSGFEHIVRENEPLAPFTWVKLGGPAQFFAEPTSIEELQGLVARCREEKLPARVLGGGSNVLIRDEGVVGLVLHLSAGAFCGVVVSGNQVTAGGGAKLGHVISAAVREGLGGLEQLVGIPGTIGGAIHGNAGANGADIGQWARAATVMTRTGEILTRKREDLRFAYRQSSLDELVVLDVKFELESDDPRELTRRMQKLWILKRAAQPESYLSAGRIFKNPGGVRAADLIDQAGLKDASVGGAKISDRNANYIVTREGATTREVIELIEKVRSQVEDRLGVALEVEIDVW